MSTKGLVYLRSTFPLNSSTDSRVPDVFSWPTARHELMGPFDYKAAANVTCHMPKQHAAYYLLNTLGLQMEHLLSSMLGRSY